MPKLKSPKNKGSAYEREVAAHMTERMGLQDNPITRAPLSGGGARFSSHRAYGTIADLVGTFDCHCELKRTEKFQPHAAMKQAIESMNEVGEKKMPVVITRRNRQTTGESFVMLSLDDWCEVWNNHLKYTNQIQAPQKPHKGD